MPKNLGPAIIDTNAYVLIRKLLREKKKKRNINMQAQTKRICFYGDRKY